MCPRGGSGEILERLRGGPGEAQGWLWGRPRGSPGEAQGRLWGSWSQVASDRVT